MFKVMYLKNGVEYRECVVGDLASACGISRRLAKSEGISVSWVEFTLS